MASAVMNRLGPGAEHPSQVRPIESAPASGRLILTPEDVYDSWQRCMAEYHVDPRSRTAPNVITQSELKVSSEPLADLMASVKGLETGFRGGAEDRQSVMHPCSSSFLSF